MVAEERALAERQKAAEDLDRQASGQGYGCESYPCKERCEAGSQGCTCRQGPGSKSSARKDVSQGQTSRCASRRCHPGEPR